LEAAVDVGLVVVPADLAVGDDLDAGVDLLSDVLSGHLVTYGGQLGVGDLTSVALVDGVTQAGGPGLVGDLGVVSDDGSLHGAPWLELGTENKGQKGHAKRRAT
jgi:hypothetical protein